MKRIIVVVTFLLALTAFTVSASAAGYPTKEAATKRIEALANWKAACGQGYWRCSDGYAEGGIKGPNRGNPEWSASVRFQRWGANDFLEQVRVHVQLNHDGSTRLLEIETWVQVLQN